MKLFRKTDGYTEVAAVPQGDLVELFVTYPGESQEVLHAHFSAKLAWRLGIWLIWYWIRDRLLGLSARKYMQTQKNRLFSESAEERQTD